MSEILLASKGNTFLGFMSAVGVLRLATKAGLPVRLGWAGHHARLTGCDREQLRDLVEKAAAEAKFEPERTLKPDAKRLPWDFCGGGRVQLNKAIPEILDDLRANPEKIDRALFGPWTWSDVGDPIGWVPTLRDHALRPHAPTKDKSFRENGAIWLAWEGIPVFGVVDGHPVGWFSPKGEPPTLRWPLWSTPASLPTVRSLLRSRPRMGATLGVVELWTVSKVRTSGKALVTTVPKPLGLDTR